MENKYGNAVWKTFKGLADHYNETKFKDLLNSPGVVKVYQQQLSECLDLAKYLRNKEDCGETRFFHADVLKMLIRLSHIRENGRLETQQEREDFIGSSLSSFNKNTQNR